MRRRHPAAGVEGQRQDAAPTFRWECGGGILPPRLRDSGWKPLPLFVGECGDGILPPGLRDSGWKPLPLFLGEWMQVRQEPLVSSRMKRAIRTVETTD